MGVREVFKELYSDYTHYHKTLKQGDEKYRAWGILIISESFGKPSFKAVGSTHYSKCFLYCFTAVETCSSQWAHMKFSMAYMIPANYALIKTDNWILIFSTLERDIKIFVQLLIFVQFIPLRHQFVRDNAKIFKRHCGSYIPAENNHLYGFLKKRFVRSWFCLVFYVQARELLWSTLLRYH